MPLILSKSVNHTITKLTLLSKFFINYIIEYNFYNFFFLSFIIDKVKKSDE